jgi:glycosyltransferase involved in cell wall biosynthesis
MVNDVKNKNVIGAQCFIGCPLAQEIDPTVLLGKSLRVLIDQQFHLGHHYQYLGHLLPVLSPLVQDVVVAITPEGLQSTEFKSFLAPHVTQARVEAVLPPASPWVPMRERWRIHGELRHIVKQFEPDYVLIPSGDAQATAMGLYRLAGLGSIPGRRPCEVGIHLGSGTAVTGTTRRLREWVNQLNLSLTGLTRAHVVNLLFYEQLRSRRLLEGRLVLMPHPVPANPRMDKTLSRRTLGIPENGRYIGLAASLDSRKAIAEFLAAFRAATSRPDERLLLAGWMNGTHRRTIEESYADLIAQGRLIVLDGFQSPETFQTVFSALDVVCTPYPGFSGVSATLLDGVSAGRPILANNFGWSEAIVKRFDLGGTCDVLNHDAFTRAVRAALDRCDEYQESEPVRRLLSFHAPGNFAATWVQGIRAQLGLSQSDVRTWNWVVDSLEVQDARAS